MIILIIECKNQVVSNGHECPVCGMDEWCGTDGCPMDPQWKTTVRLFSWLTKWEDQYPK